MLQGLTDTHCHLNHADFDADLGETIARAREAGLTRLLVIGYDLASSRAALRIALDHPDVQAAIGIHPETAGEWSDEVRGELTQTALDHPQKVIGIGEIGLDYHWESIPRDDQKRVFVDQLDLAFELSLPVVVHCRDAYADVIDIFESRPAPARAVLHCFTGTASEAHRAIDLGLYLGVGGILTYKKSAELRDLFATLPLDRILIETDAPYLAPQKWRGKRNEPAYVVSVAHLLAEIRGASGKEIADATTANAQRLFGAANA